MKLTFDRTHVTITREPGDKPIYKESTLWHAIRQALPPLSLRGVRQVPGKDGHLTGAPYYIRVYSGKVETGYIYDGDYAVRCPAKAYREAGKLVLSWASHGAPAPALADSATLERFTAAYIHAALWAETDNANDSGGEPLENNYSADDIVKKDMATIRRECAEWWAANREDLEEALTLCPGKDQVSPDGNAYYPEEYLGHDFWLTRNGHGAGFWDRDYLEADGLGDRLSEAARKAGGRSFYIHRKRLYYTHA